MKNNKTVQQLKQEGFRVDVYHGRRFLHKPTGNVVVMSRRDMGKENETFQKECELLNDGGFSLVELSKDGKTSRGKYNFSTHTSFHRKISFTVALGRAVKNFND